MVGDTPEESGSSALRSLTETVFQMFNWAGRQWALSGEHTWG